MKVRTKHIRMLLEELAHQCGASLDSAGFIQMADIVTTPRIEISGRYLREQLFERMQKAEKAKEDEMEVMVSKPDVIAAHLGYESFLKFIRAMETPLPEALLSCIGNWYSYVRVNSGNPELLVAPVMVNRENNKVVVELIGSQRLFRGHMKLRAGNAVVYLDSTGGKAMTMILKPGINARPEVLTGVFAGISSSGDPICGREVWVRFEGDRNEMHWHRVNLSATGKHGDLDERLRSYFDRYDKNCIKATAMSQFNLNDLLNN